MNTRNDTSADPSPSTAIQVDHRTMLDTIEKIWPQIAPIQGARLRDAIRSIPEAEWRTRPRILLALAASHRSVGSTSRSAALPWFRAVQKNIQADPTSDLDVRAGYLIHLAATQRSLGSLHASKENLERARTMIEGDESLEISKRISLSASFSLQLGLVRIHLGAFDEALFALSLAEGLADEHLSTAEKVECLSALAFVNFLLGDFPVAEEQADLAEQHAEGTDLFRSTFAALAHITRFMLAVDQADATTELGQLIGDLRVCTAGSDWEPQAVFAEALARYDRGAFIETLDLLGRVARLLAPFVGEVLVSSASDIHRAETMRMLGEVEQARRLSAALTPSQHHVTCPASIQALSHFTVGDPQAALDVLADCLELGDLHSTRSMAQVYAITAAAQNDLDNPVASNIAFDRALLVAATHGTTWPFQTLPGEVVDRLLARAAARVQSPIVAALVERLHGTPHEDTQPLADPLSDRELVIVRHLATGATLSQIGAELFISVNTVKSHVRSIYRKLSATNRREAITRANQLGLTEER
ncbi:helix-turn-helix transcriptional regulator [Frondihabitans cladoniiphilus]|uniref:HTH luxR-type domain-containing protein n=1 Tax=Frondihabitans cladoniiphilus TaxID=715785 RepID=A0ABP8W2J6_9MICO